MAYSVSFAKTNITPTLSTNPYMAGYGTDDGGRVATSSTPYQPLYARAVVLWENGSPNLILAVDVLAIPRAMHQRLRSRILALAGWGSSDIMLHATHTHNGPVLTDTLQPFMAYGTPGMDLIRTYTKNLEDKIVATAQAALNATQTTVTLDYKVLSLNMAFNRAGLQYAETAVPVLAARRSDGTVMALIFSYGCHPVAAGLRTLFDGDFCAGACAYIEARSAAFALFLQGPAGDQNPMGTPSWSLRDQYANSLGSLILNNYGSAGRALTGPFTTKLQEYQLPLDIDTSAGNLATVRNEYAARMPNPVGNPAWYGRHAQVMMGRIDVGGVPTSIPLPIQVWTIGGSTPLKIAYVGSELVSGYAWYFRPLYGGTAALWIGGYANETTCYLPSNQFFPPYMTDGSYEGGWDTDYPGLAGGNMTVYGHMAHFKYGSGGIESTLINAITAMLG